MNQRTNNVKEKPDQELTINKLNARSLIRGKYTHIKYCTSYDQS